MTGARQLSSLALTRRDPVLQGSTNRPAPVRTVQPTRTAVLDPPAVLHVQEDNIPELVHLLVLLV